MTASTAPEPTDDALEARFVDNWAGLARAFGMDPQLGRVHALAFVRPEPLSAAAVSAALGLAHADAERYLEELAGWGVVTRNSDAPEATFSADADPWRWFMTTLRERGRREFGPLLAALRETNAAAQRASERAHPERRRSLERIARFTQFVEQIAGLVETLAAVGAGPMMAALRVAARMRRTR